MPDVQSPQQVGVYAVPGLRLARARLAMDRLQPHLSHQPPYPVPARHQPLPPRMAAHLPTAIKRVRDVQLVDAPLQRQRRRVGLPRAVVLELPAFGGQKGKIEEGRQC